MEHFNVIGLLLFGLVTMMTPGANHYILFSYGKSYGFKGSYRTMSGIFLGFMTILFITGYGVAEIIMQNETVAFVFKILSSLWLLYLAYSLTHLKATKPEGLKKKVGVAPMFLMQFINPKVWIIGITGASAFMPTYDNIHTNVLIYALSLPMLGIPIMLSWVSFGDIFSRFLKSERSNKTVNYVLAGLLTLSVFLIWGKELTL